MSNDQLSARRELLANARDLLARRDRTHDPGDGARTLELAFEFVVAALEYLEAEGALEAMQNKADRVD
jgi:hypothetical protein